MSVSTDVAAADSSFRLRGGWIAEHRARAFAEALTDDGLVTVNVLTMR